MLVESPLSFVSFLSEMGKRVANLSSLNLFFLGERAASIPSYVPMTVAKKFAKERQENLDDPEGL